MKAEKKQIFKNNGFTLIELLVVIAVLGVLASIILVSLDGARLRVRDVKRVAQLREVQKGLEFYYNKYGNYPHLENTNVAENWEDLVDILINEDIIAKKDYVPKTNAETYNSSFLVKLLNFSKAEAAAPLIQDPLFPEYSFGYMSSSEPLDQNFRLRAELENTQSDLLASSLSGSFLYTDEYTGENACDKNLGYYCIGPLREFMPFNPGKPVIYLYPVERQEITVKVRPEKITESVPAYNNGGWRVIASPDGNIYNIEDGKDYPYLFWEGKSQKPVFDKTKGFIVESQKVEEFLAEKLSKLGLNKKETADFIEYWAPRMKNKPFAYVYFMPQADFDKLIPIEVSPKPDTIIRIYMLFKSLDERIKVQEQEIITPERNGFTVVEWGGDRSEIKLESY